MIIQCPYCGEEYTNDQVKQIKDELVYIHPPDSYVAFPNAPSTFYKRGCSREISKQVVTCTKCNNKYEFNIFKYNENNPKVKNEKCRRYLKILSGKSNASDDTPSIIDALNRYFSKLEKNIILDRSNNLENNMFLLFGVIILGIALLVAFLFLYIIPSYIILSLGAKGTLLDIRVILPLIITIILLFILWRHYQLLNKFIKSDSSPMQLDKSYIETSSYQLYQETTLNGLLNGRILGISSPTVTGILFAAIYWIALILNYNNIFNTIPTGIPLGGILLIAWLFFGLVVINSFIYFIIGNAIIIGLSTLSLLWLITSTVPFKINLDGENNLHIVGKLIFSYIYLLAGSILVFITEYYDLSNNENITLLTLSHYLNEIVNILLNINITSLGMIILYIAFILLILFVPALYVRDKIIKSKKNKKKLLIDEINRIKSIDGDNNKINRLQKDVENLSNFSEWPFDFNVHKNLWNIFKSAKDFVPKN